MSALLEVERLNSYYGDSHILFDVSLRVERNEVVALLGRNGAGKSTTLKSLIGAVRPRSGRIVGYPEINHRYRTGRPIFQREFLGATASGSHTRRIFFPASMTCKERPSYDISIHVLKYALATLIQGVALALRHQLSKHASHCVYSIHEIIQLRKSSFGERSPSFRRASHIAETKEQKPDFTQCKPELTRMVNDCQPVKR